MSEMVKNFAMLLWVACALNGSMPPAEAQGIREENEMTAPSAAAPTIVFGKSEQPDGSTDEFVLEQPAGSANPLGNPLPEVVEPEGADASAAVTAPRQTGEEKTEKQTEPLPADAAAAQKLGTQFQNTLMEADGMVYDIQAYPTQDLKAIGNPSNPETIYSPNVNP